MSETQLLLHPHFIDDDNTHPTSGRKFEFLFNVVIVVVFVVLVSVFRLKTLNAATTLSVG